VPEEREGLTRVSLSDLERLHRLLAAGRLQAPLSATALQAAGLGNLHTALAAVNGLDTPAVLIVLQIAIAERTRRPVPHLDLVWTGPDVHGSQARDTAVVVRELFQAARRSVLVAGFAFDHAEDILRPLHTVMKTHGVDATLFIDLSKWTNAMIPGDPGEAAADTFLAQNWPFGDPRPALYYDPRTPFRNPEVSLHAKCVVIDELRTFVTSANFTGRAQSRNLELGVLIEDSAFARQITQQWRGLVSAGFFKGRSGSESQWRPGTC
jgi:phosphatidylserine/phosphatidylglycerophosphate/cardiolipin synthase-like enzyme